MQKIPWLVSTRIRMERGGDTDCSRERKGSSVGVKREVTATVSQEPSGQVQDGGAPASQELKHIGQENTTHPLLQRMESSRRAELKVDDPRLQRGPDLNRRRSESHSFTRDE